MLMLSSCLEFQPCESKASLRDFYLSIFFEISVVILFLKSFVKLFLRLIPITIISLPSLIRAPLGQFIQIKLKQFFLYDTMSD